MGQVLVLSMVREAEHAETKPDFKHKMAIAQKEINETIYWLELLKETNYLTKKQFDSIHSNALESLVFYQSLSKQQKPI